MLAMLFGQSFEAADLMVVGLLIVLEGALSVDNALVLGLLAKRLPPHQRKRALTYGLVGAFVFRFMAIAVAAWLLEYPIVKILGGGYLLYVALKHFFFESADDEEEKQSIKIGPDGHPIVEDDEHREAEIAKRSPVPDAADPSTPIPHGKRYAKFWPTVLVIELTDIAFAVDSIVAAMAFIPPKPEGAVANPKLWVVIAGGFVGVVLMRFAAMIFVKLLDRFPKFEVAAYLLVCVIGLKLVLDYVGHQFFPGLHVDFHSVTSPWTWGFWTIMIACFAYGFWPTKRESRGFDVTPPTGSA
jgi:YkoY family integral membrane protein